MEKVFEGYNEIEIHKGESYGGYSINGIKKIIKLLKNVKNINDVEEINDILVENGYNPIFFGMSEIIAGISNNYIDLDNISEKYFLRISEPKIDYMADVYMSSWNYADDRREKGISVISSDWLKSLKSVFFGVSDEDIKSRGVYIMKGIVIGKGGDDEPLILATDFAKKTNIKTKEQLKKAVEYYENIQ